MADRPHSTARFHESRFRGDVPPPPATPGVVSPSLVETESPEPAPAAPTSEKPAPVADADERDLLEARVGGSDSIAAFARLYDRHAPIVLAVCRRFTGDHHADDAEAEDAMQETFMRAHRLLDRLEVPGQFRAWLLGIARRVCAERRRSTSRRLRHEHEALASTPRDDGAEIAITTAAREESLRRLDVSLDMLAEDERLAIHLYYLDPDPVHAADTALGLSRSAFYKLLARARGQLARLMREESTS